MNSLINQIQNRISTNLWRAYSISFLKNPLQISTNFQVILPISGFLSLATNRSFTKATKVLMLMTLIGSIPLAQNFSQSSGLRYLQLLGIIFAFNHMQLTLTHEKVNKVVSYIAVLSAITLILDIFHIGPESYKNWFNLFSLPRYNGVIGEPNFSGALYFGILLICALEKRWRLCFLYFILVLSTGGRTAILSAIAYILFYISKKFVKILPRFIIWIFLTAITIFPLFSVIEPYLGIPKVVIQQKINPITSNRYGITKAYLEIFKDHPLGIGYFNGRKIINTPPYQKITPQKSEQHNIFLQILTEFGLLAYLLMIVSLFKLFKLLTHEHGASLSFLFLVFFSINGVNEFVLYFFLSYLLIIRNKTQKTKIIENNENLAHRL